jgi:hypothetical protein
LSQIPGQSDRFDCLSLWSFHQYRKPTNQDVDPEPRLLILRSNALTRCFSRKIFCKNCSFELRLRDHPHVGVHAISSQSTFDLQQSRHRKAETNDKACYRKERDQSSLIVFEKQLHVYSM